MNYEDAELAREHITTGMMSQEEQALLVQEANTQHFKSDFNFINEHKGWRPGKIHLALAPTGAGKSTLVRSIIWDFLVNNEFRRIYLWLSEESINDFKTEFAKLGIPPELTRNLYIGSEQDIEGTVDDRKRLFAAGLESSMPDIVIFDNVTTSQFYVGRKPEEQASFAMYIKGKCKKSDIPFIIIGHTGGATLMNKRLLEVNDIKGTKDIVNITEFAYILQRFRVINPMTNREEFFPTIRIEKHRGYTCENLLFKLKFNKETVTFMEDKPVPWEEFKEAFKQQLTL